MNPELKYERIGKFIYGACRHGGGLADVHEDDGSTPSRSRLE